MLKIAYEDYFKGNTLFVQNLIICVVEVENDSIKKITPFYYKSSFSEKLEEQNLEDLIEYISTTKK